VELQDKVVKIIETIARSPGPFTSDESLFDSGVLDSFALPELVAALEQAFSIRIPDSDLNADTFESVSKISSYIQRQS
jgi:acyl carrier protein